MAACSIGPDVNGNRCGAPAVSSFVGRDGDVFHECADHDSSPIFAPSAPVAVGDRVNVDHVGVIKVGVVVDVRRSRVSVRVPIGRGANASHKVIDRSFDDIRPV